MSLIGSRSIDSVLPKKTPKKCTTLWHKYRDYRECVGEWGITPSETDKSSQYWKYFMYSFQNELRSYHQAEITVIPPEWFEIGEEKAIESLKNLRS